MNDNYISQQYETHKITTSSLLKQRKLELKLYETSKTVSSFMERKFGHQQWIKVTINEYDIAYKDKQQNIHSELMKFALNGIKWNHQTYKYCCHKDNILYFFSKQKTSKLKMSVYVLGYVFHQKYGKICVKMGLGWVNLSIIGRYQD